MQYDRRLAFLGMGYININLANFYAMVATITDLRIENHRIVGCRDIRNGDYFFPWHLFPPEISSFQRDRFRFLRKKPENLSLTFVTKDITNSKP
jgi:hypothetical protein